MATKSTFEYRVQTVSEAGEGRVNVNLVQVVDANAEPGLPQYTNSISFNMASDEAKAYWPGQAFTMTLAPKSTSA